MRALPSGLVTFCFVDVAGSTRAFQSDPERYPDALRAHHELVRDAFAADGGVIVETEGDGLFAAFGDAARAVNGCLAAQLAIARHRWPPGPELRSRMGLHCDTAACPPATASVALGVHQAARVAAAASGGQVLCSAAVAERASGRLQPGATLAALGSYRLKDFDAPAVLFELHHPAMAVESQAPRAPRVGPGNMRLSRTSFVGRDEEAGELRALLAEHRLVTILGPGGVGKTRSANRLAGELTDSFAQGAWVVELAGVAGAELVTDAVARELPLPGLAGGSPDDAVLALPRQPEPCCWSSTTASTCLPGPPGNAGRPAARCCAGRPGAGRQAGCRLEVAGGSPLPNRARRRLRLRTPRLRTCWTRTRCGCSWPGPGPPGRTSRWTRRTRRWSRRSASGWTGCHWRWSWPGPAWPRSPW